MPLGWGSDVPENAGEPFPEGLPCWIGISLKFQAWWRERIKCQGTEWRLQISSARQWGKRNLSSPALLNSPKSQPDSEKPSVTKDWNLPKRHSTSEGTGSKPKETGGGGGCTRDKLQSHTTQAADPHTGEQFYRRSSPTGARALRPRSGCPARGSDSGGRSPPPPPAEHLLWRPAGPKRRRSTGKQRCHSWGPHTGPRAKAVPSREPGQAYLLVVEDLLGGGRWLWLTVGMSTRWTYSGTFISLSSPGGPCFGNKASPRPGEDRLWDASRQTAS